MEMTAGMISITMIMLVCLPLTYLCDARTWCGRKGDGMILFGSFNMFTTAISHLESTSLGQHKTKRDKKKPCERLLSATKKEGTDANAPSTSSTHSLKTPTRLLFLPIIGWMGLAGWMALLMVASSDGPPRT